MLDAMTSYKMKSAKCYDKDYKYGVHTLSRSGKAKNKTKQGDLTLQVSNISQSCDTGNDLCPRRNGKESQSSHPCPVSEKHHTSLKFCLGFGRGYWGHLSLP